MEALLINSDDEIERNPRSVDESNIKSLDDNTDEKATTYRAPNWATEMEVLNDSPEKNGLLLVYDISSHSLPKLLFRYRRPLPVLPKDSTPVFHPTKSLLVWPLFGGDIIFADF